MQIEQVKLKNNLNTLFIHSPGSNAATVQMWFRAGSALEGNSNEGIAHFLEHMFFKGTERRPGYKIVQEVESFGGEINAFTSFDYTCYYINTPSSKIENTVDILMDMVSNPTFKPEEIPSERDVVFEEYLRSLDNPSQFAFSKIQESCFEGPYGHPILGNEKTIKSFSREQLVDFRADHYNLKNSMLVVSGDLYKKEELKKKIEEFNMPSGSTSNFPEFELSSKPKVEIHTKDVRQALLTISLQCPSVDHNFAAAEDLAINCIAHGDTSRLGRRLVHDTSLASSVGGSTMFFNKGGCHFLRIASPTENLKKVLSDFFRVLESLKKDPLSFEEVKKIKNQYIASKVYEKESIESYSFSLGHSYAQTGDINFEDQFIERVSKTSVDEVNKAIWRILSRPLHLSLQIPKDERPEKYEKLIKEFQKKVLSSSKKFKLNNKKGKVAESGFDPQVKVQEIKPGVKLIYRKNDMTPTFVFHAYLKGGLTDETKSNNGMYNLLSNTITKGHKKFPYETIKSDLEEKSASIGGFAGRNAYGLTMHGQSMHTKALFDHFFNTLFCPDFTKKRLDHEKELVYRSLENQKEDPIRQCFKEFNQIIFEGHPYSFNSLGREASVKKISSKALKDLHKKNLAQREILFTYCGDLELEEVLLIINEKIKILKPRKVKKTKAKKMKQASNKKIMVELAREQTQVFIGRKAYKLGQKNDSYLKMLTSHLSGQSSELFVEIRDKRGLCYTVQPVHFTALEAGYWGIYIATSNDKTNQAITEINKLLKNICDKGLSEKEFERIKRMIEGNTLINIQTNDDYANTYSVPELHGLGIDFYYNNNEFIKSSKLEDFNKWLKSFLKSSWNQVVVGKK